MTFFYHGVTKVFTEITEKKLWFKKFKIANSYVEE